MRTHYLTTHLKQLLTVSALGLALMAAEVIAAPDNYSGTYVPQNQNQTIIAPSNRTNDVQVGSISAVNSQQQAGKPAHSRVYPTSARYYHPHEALIRRD